MLKEPPSRIRETCVSTRPGRGNGSRPTTPGCYGPHMSPVLRAYSSLDASLDALQVADDLNDEDRMWAALRHALDALHKCEVRDRASHQQAYFRRRDASVEGRTAAGLIWVRGLIEHHDAEMRTHLFKPFAIAGEDRALQPLVHLPAMPGETAMVFVDDVLWPERHHLPTPGRRYKPHQRDTYYDLLVAGRPLIDPLRAARSYFSSQL